MARVMSRPDDMERFEACTRMSGKCLIWIGRLDRGGYGRFWSSKEKRRVMAHRFSYESSGAIIPDGYQIDHICHNTSCVLPAHLRLATPSQNKQNTGVRSDSRSGIKGVAWSPRQRRWRASVVHEGKRHWLGYFREQADAKAAVVAKRNELFTHNDADRSLT